MDLQSLAVFLAFAMFIGGFGALVIWSIRAERARQAAMTALAEARGWRYEHEQRGARQASRFAIHPEGEGDEWQLQVTRRRSGGKRRSSHPGSSEFRAPSPALPEGLVVVMPEMGKGIAGAAATMAGLFDNRIGRALISKSLGPEIGEHLGRLQDFPAPEGSRAMVLATADPSLWFDIAAIAEAIHSWHPRKGSDRSAPMVVIDAGGFRMRVNYEVGDPDLVEQFIALGQQVQQVAARNR